MPDTTHVLITGCNRGIGRALFAAYISRPSHTVIAAVRDPTAASSIGLKDSLHGAGSKTILVKLDSASKTDASVAIELLKTEHGLQKLDLVIANAGISKYFGKATVTPAEEMLDHFTVNSLAPLLLFQAAYPLLSAAPQPKFVTISSGAGSLGMVEQLNVENTAYGASKAALNFVTRRIHYENPELIAFSINPGWLQTDVRIRFDFLDTANLNKLGNHAATSSGMSVAPVAVEDGVNGIVSVIDEATREKTSGKFMTWDKQQLPW